MTDRHMGKNEIACNALSEVTDDRKLFYEQRKEQEISLLN